MNDLFQSSVIINSAFATILGTLVCYLIKKIGLDPFFMSIRSNIFRDLSYDEYKIISKPENLTEKEIRFFCHKISIKPLNKDEFIYCKSMDKESIFLLDYSSLAKSMLPTGRVLEFKNSQIDYTKFYDTSSKRWLWLIVAFIFYIILGTLSLIYVQDSYKSKEWLNLFCAVLVFLLSILLVTRVYIRIDSAKSLMKLQSKSRTEQKNIPEKVDDIPNLVETHSKWVVSINILGKKLLTIQKEH